MKTLELELHLINSKYFNIRQDLIVPNVSWGLFQYECDLTILKPSGYAYEVELKISKSDLIKDKNKHHKHCNTLIKRLYFAIPSYLGKYIEYIPLHAGIFVVSSKGAVIKVKEARNNKIAKKLSEKEQFQLARLGALRIWGLKKKILKFKKSS